MAGPGRFAPVAGTALRGPGDDHAPPIGDPDPDDDGPDGDDFDDDDDDFDEDGDDDPLEVAPARGRRNVV